MLTASHTIAYNPSQGGEAILGGAGAVLLLLPLPSLHSLVHVRLVHRNASQSIQSIQSASNIRTLAGGTLPLL